MNQDFRDQTQREMSANQQDKFPEGQLPMCFSYRLLVAIIAMLSLCLGFGTQTSMSSALVCMIDTDNSNRQVKASNVTDTQANSNSNLNDSWPRDHEKNDWKFSWNYSEKGWTLTVFFFGAYVMQLATGAILLPRFGIKNTLVGSLVLIVIFHFLTVPAAFAGLTWLYVVRFLAGVVTGPLFVSVIGLMANWAPPLERSFLFGITGIGNELGGTFAYAISAVSCSTNVQGGWPFVFYVLGAFGICVTSLHLLFVSDVPTTNKRLGSKEKGYIAQCCYVDQTRTRKTIIPYKKIFKSLPVWAIIVGRLGGTYMFQLALMQTPVFFADVLRLSQSEVSLASGIPFLVVIPTVYVAGIISDRLLAKGILSITGIRKTNDAIAKVVCALMFITLGFLPERSVAPAFIVNMLIAAALGMNYLSYVPNPADISPIHAGFLTGLSTTFANWVSFVMPIIVVAMTKGKTRQEWQNTFYLGAGIHITSSIFYTIFASGELQSWATNEGDYDVMVSDVNRKAPCHDNTVADNEPNRENLTDVKSHGTNEKTPLLFRVS